jgi:hypothetical protein
VAVRERTLQVRQGVVVGSRRADGKGILSLPVRIARADDVGAFVTPDGFFRRHALIPQVNADLTSGSASMFRKARQRSYLWRGNDVVPEVGTGTMSAPKDYLARKKLEGFGPWI